MLKFFEQEARFPRREDVPKPAVDYLAGQVKVDPALFAAYEFTSRQASNWASMKHELRHMRTQGSGAIVHCSSLGGLVGIPGRASYHASKHGVIGLTTSAALEYAPRGVRINAVCPGTIDTPMVTDMIAKGELDQAEAEANQPINRLGTAEEIAQAVLWLCSPGASFVVGVALPVDGGYVAR
ncbi:SDR family oxidoreductase [Nonomuraea sp. NPDC023979]|uniref:SDR family oxidoreductase n=1 Tax=Nonomuraea sp. NPDC023979 TaxID=3154796 RepID=UPI0033E19DEF